MDNGKQNFPGIVPGLSRDCPGFSWDFLGILFMCFHFSPGKRETHKQFDPHPFPGQSREFVYVYCFFCPPKCTHTHTRLARGFEMDFAARVSMVVSPGLSVACKQAEEARKNEKNKRKRMEESGPIKDGSATAPATAVPKEMGLKPRTGPLVVGIASSRPRDFGLS